MIIQTDNRQYVRDTTNRALLTTDTHALARARAHRERLRRSDMLEREVDSLQQHVLELKTVVHQLLKTSHG